MQRQKQSARIVEEEEEEEEEEEKAECHHSQVTGCVCPGRSSVWSQPLEGVVLVR
jgi:hypothetical protein